MSTQPAAPHPNRMREGESYDAFADRLLEHHGAPPEAVVAHVHSLKLQAARRAGHPSTRRKA